MTCKVYCPTSVIQDIGVVPETGYNPYFFPSEGAYLPFFFTDETFVKVLSALVNGAAITYGDEGRAVVWEFLRNVEFPVTICEQIIACIEGDADVRAALRDFITSDEAISNYFTTIVDGMTSDQIASNIVDNGCENSDVAGAVIQIVDTLDAYNVDALEIIEVGTNDEERMASLLSGIPVFGILPVDEAFDLLQDFLEDFAENYNAAITPEWKNEVSEDLYCIALAQSDCKLTYALLFEYFQERATSGLTLASGLYDLVNFIRTGDFDTDELVASGMYAVLLASLRVGREYFGIDAVSLGVIARDASPSSAWEDWDECTAPDEWIDNNFSGGDQHDWDSIISGGVDFAIWIGTGFDRYQDASQIAIAKTVSGVVTDIEVYFSAPLSGSGGVMYAGATGLTGLQIGSTTDDQMWSWSGVAISGGIGLDLYRVGGFASGQYVTRVRYKIAP
jgi:hypothetical protein